MSAHQIGAFATNKATLFEMAEKLPGAGLDFLRDFTADITSSGLVAAAASRAGLKGVLTSEK